MPISDFDVLVHKQEYSGGGKQERCRWRFWYWIRTGINGDKYWSRKDTEGGTGKSRNGTHKDNCTGSKILLTSSISLRLLLL